MLAVRLITKYLAFVAILSSSACVFVFESENPGLVRPEDLPGTMESASLLILDGHGVLGDDSTPIDVCLNPDGICIPADYRVAECHRYDDIEVHVDGIAIPQQTTGGWSSVQRFQPLPEGGNGYGCSYPKFRLDDLGFDARSRNTEITIRVGHETATVNGIADIQPDDWVDGGFVFHVPLNLPAGAGQFGYGEAWVPVEVTNCSFASCPITVNRSTEVDGVSVVEP